MRLLFIIALSICALLIDYYIYRRISKRWVQLIYLGYALTIDILIFAIIFIGFRWPFYGIHSVSPLPLWLAWLFFLNSIPKCVYFLFYFLSKKMAISAGRWIRLLGMVLTFYTTFVLLKGAFYNTHHIEVKHVTIESSKIPSAFDGYRIAFFSDVHLGNLSKKESFLNQFVEQVNQLNPHLIVHTGDLVNMYATEISPAVQTILSKLSAVDGVYGVLGNHDMGPYFRKRVAKTGLTPSIHTHTVKIRQQEMGWRVLQNEAVQIGRGSDSIGLCGVPYPPLPPKFPDSLTNFNLTIATKTLDRDRFNILLCHTPIVWETMRDTQPFKRIDLTLSGHVHAMQTKMEIGSWQWSPARFMYRYWSGLYEYEGRFLYVNEGLGYVLYPMRIGGKPEITLITLKNKW